MDVDLPNQGRLEGRSDLVVHASEVVDTIERVAMEPHIVGIDSVKRELDIGDPTQQRGGLVVEDADERRGLRRVEWGLRVALVVDYPGRVGLKVAQQVEIVPPIGRVHDGSRHEDPTIGIVPIAREDIDAANILRTLEQVFDDFHRGARQRHVAIDEKILVK
jgi:hypothetical protein